MADGKITTEEMQNLSNWLDDNTHLVGCYPYDEIYSVVTAVLRDGVVDSEEEKLLKLVFSDFVDLNTIPSASQSEIERIKKEITISGICAMDPPLKFEDAVFCFTGKSSRSNREEIGRIINANRGVLKNAVTKDIHFLIIGDGGNPCWAYSCYGRKVEQAIELRKKGGRILIVHENDFWDHLE